MGGERVAGRERIAPILARRRERAQLRLALCCATGKALLQGGWLQGRCAMFPMRYSRRRTA